MMNDERVWSLPTGIFCKTPDSHCPLLWFPPGSQFLPVSDSFFTLFTLNNKLFLALYNVKSDALEIRIPVFYINI